MKLWHVWLIVVFVLLLSIFVRRLEHTPLW